MGLSSLGTLEAIFKDDLPEWLDPMIVKELRQNLRRAVFVYPFMLVQLLAMAAVGIEFSAGEAGTGITASGFSTWASSVAFWNVATIACVIVIPLTGIGLMRQELDDGKNELLIMTKLNLWRVVRGKFFALWGLSVLTFVSLLPYVVVRYMQGGVEWWQEIARSVGIIGNSAMMCAMVIGVSGYKSMWVRFAVLVWSGLMMIIASMGTLMFSLPMHIGWFTLIFYAIAMVQILAYVCVGLGLARSHLHVFVSPYRTHPVRFFTTMVILAPLIYLFAALVTCGLGGIFTFIAMGILSIQSDPEIESIHRIAAPRPDIPPPLS